MRIHRLSFRTVVSLGLAALLAACGGGGVGGAYDWTIVGVGTTSVTAEGWTSDVLEYEFDVPDDAEPEQQWRIARSSWSDGTVDIDWQIDGFHGWFQDWLEITAFSDGPDGTETVVVLSTPRDEFVPGETDGPFSFAGSVRLRVHDGYEHGFLVAGANFDSGGALVGEFRIHEGAPTP